MFRLMMSIVIVLTLYGAAGVSVYAQDAPTIYTVTGQQTINARGCPRLSCPVLRTFAPGDQLTVIEVTQGETVLGSDEWLHLNIDGVDLFVHSSLAAPLPASGRDASEDSAPADNSSGDSASGDSASGDSASEATHDWVAHTGAGFAIDTPPNWIDITTLLYDESYMADAMELLGEDSEEAVQALKTMCGEGACDLVMVEFGGKAALFMLHIDGEGMPQSAQLWRILLEDQFKEQGADVISAEVVDLPVGEAVRIDLIMEIGTAKWEMEYIVYTVITGDRMYMLLFYMDSCCVEDYTVIIDQVAASFRLETETIIE